MDKPDEIYRELRKIHPVKEVGFVFSRELLQLLWETTLQFYRTIKDTFPKDPNITFLIGKLETSLREWESTEEIEYLRDVVLFALHRNVSGHYTYEHLQKYLPKWTD